MAIKQFCGKEEIMGWQFLVTGIRLQCRRPGFDPWVGKIPWSRERLQLQHSGLENSMDCIVHGVTKSLTQLSDFDFHSVPLFAKSGNSYQWVSTLPVKQGVWPLGLSRFSSLEDGWIFISLFFLLVLLSP